MHRGGFVTFKAERWEFTSYASEPLKEWLQQLSKKGPKVP